MHELSLMQNLIEDVVAGLRERGIERPGAVESVMLTIGALEIHSTESFRQAFEVATRGTPLDGAALELTVRPARLHCSACGIESAVGEDEADGHLPLPVAMCPTCGAVCAVEGGRGVEPIELTLRDG
jgi:hydrogenase nickel incorporation protein HypA/HybF